MNIVKLGYEIIEQEPGLTGLYKAAELPGRICYGSMDKITDTSADEFVKRLMKSNHGAPLEHGTVYLTRSIKYPDYSEMDDRRDVLDFVNKYAANKYSVVRENQYRDHFFITTNLRVLFENDWLYDLKYFCDPTPYHEKRIMVRFTTNIGVTREYNRHRANSINEESTRYNNYTKDKHGNEISVTMNGRFYDKEDKLADANKSSLEDWCKIIAESGGDGFTDIDYWVFGNKAAEWSYSNLINKCGWRQQDARDLLPLDLKSNLIHTAFEKDWVHFFELRAIGTTGAPHPQAKELAYPLMEEFLKRGYITKDELYKNSKKQ